MVAAVLQVLTLFFALLTVVPAMAAEIAKSGTLWSAVGAVSLGQREALAIGTLCVLELVMRIGARVLSRPLGDDTLWSFATLHFIVATVVLVCLGLDLFLCGDLASLRQNLWGMQYKLAAAGFSLAYAVREFLHRRRAPPERL